MQDPGTALHGPLKWTRYPLHRGVLPGLLGWMAAASFVSCHPNCHAHPVGMGADVAMLLQARSVHSLKVQGWLREEALEWGMKIDNDMAGKEKDTEMLKQERQRDLIRLKVDSLCCPSSNLSNWMHDCPTPATLCMLLCIPSSTALLLLLLTILQLLA